MRDAGRVIRLLPGFISRRLAAARAVRRVAGRWTETSVDGPRDWRVTAPISLARADDHAATIELAVATALRYEAIHVQTGYDNGGWWSGTRRFLVLDGEHAGVRVVHNEFGCRDPLQDDAWCGPLNPFPPAGLEPAWAMTWGSRA